jgi:hypothetical protein
MSDDTHAVIDALQELLETHTYGQDPHGTTVADSLCHIEDSLRLLLHAYCLANKLSYEDVFEAYWETIPEPKEVFKRSKKA